ncbi:MAG: MFS transporter, partial [Flavobacterium sp.]|nr:MFS transporter [Flavobacterium sp.]
FTQSHRVDLIANLDGSKFEVQQRIQQLQMGFMSKGFSSSEALDKAHKAIEMSVMKQSTVLAYMDIFMYLGILFLICVPFVLLIKKGAGGKVDMSNVH